MNPIKIALLCLALGSSYSFAECTAPQVPVMPDGTKATMEEMVAGKTAVAAFQQANATYMDCVGKQMEDIKATFAEGSKEAAEAARLEYNKLSEIYNVAVTNEETLAEKFNGEIRAFKGAEKK